MVSRILYPAYVLFILALLLVPVGLWLTSRYEVVKGPYRFSFTLSTEKPGYFYDLGKLQVEETVRFHLDFWPSAVSGHPSPIYQPGLLSYADYDRLNATGRLYDYSYVAFVSFRGIVNRTTYDLEAKVSGRDNYYAYIFGLPGTHMAEITVGVYAQRDLGWQLVNGAIWVVLFSGIAIFLERMFPSGNEERKAR